MSQLTPEQFEQVQRIFLEVRELAAEQRGPALAAYAADVRREVISLLSADEGCGEFLERPALNTDTESMTSVAPDKPTYPDRVGPYRLLQQIGEGGFGTVFMAEQVEPVHRKVAVKLIKPGMDSKQVLARFQAERQALAMMDHPSIARFFDVGTTDNGLPYFVMELVRGIPIDDFCEQNALSLIERLDLIGQVCRAVHHAHRKGVIHRDLKPSNVLVGMGEEGPVAKVIDFGIAKALDARLSESTLFTEFGQMVGTLEYMSPEQAEMSVVDIDTRSDVYSLGVLLYKLLTGSTPISRDQLLKHGVFEIPRVMREITPSTPSAHVTAVQRHASRSASTSTPGVLPLTRSDLDWITMKCLAKDRRERYDSANDLACDIVNFLHGLPVTAHPPSLAYRVRKLVRRHRVAALLMATVGTSLLLGTVGLIVGFRKARLARDAAERSLQAAVAAQQEADHNARQLAENMYAELINSSWRAIQQNDATRATELLDACLPDLRGWEWSFVKSEVQTSASQVLRQPGSASINEIAIHNDLGLLAVVLANGDIEIRDRAQDRLVRAIQMPDRATTVEFLRDVIVVGTGAGELQWIGVDDWSLRSRRQLMAGGIYDIAASPSGDRLAVCTGGAWVKLLDREQQIVDEWQLPTRLSQVVFQHERSLIGAGLDGNLYRLTSSDPEVREQLITSSSLNGIVRIANNRVCVLGGGVAFAVDADDRSSFALPMASWTGVANCIAVADDEPYVAIGAGDGQVVVARADGIGPSTEHPLGASVGAACWDSRGRRFIVGLSDGRLVPLPLSQAATLWQSESISHPTGGQLLSRHGIAVYVDDGGWLHGMDGKTGEQVFKQQLHQGAVWNVAVDRAEDVLVSVGEDAMLRCWQLPDLKQRFEVSVGWGVRDVCVAADGSWIAAQPPSSPKLQEGTIGIWSTETGDLLRTLEGHRNWVLSMGVSPDGRYLVSGCENRDIRFWNTASWQPEHVIEPPLRAPPEHIAFADKDRVFVGHRDGWITSWELSSGEPGRAWAAFGDAISGMFCVEGRILATSQSSPRLKAWDAKSGRSLADFGLGTGYITAMLLSTDTTTVAMFQDGIIKVRSIATP